MSEVEYVPLRGRLDPGELPWMIRMMLKLVAKGTKDPEAKKRMSDGFDYMDRESLNPILDWFEYETRPVMRREEELVAELVK